MSLSGHVTKDPVRLDQAVRRYRALLRDLIIAVERLTPDLHDENHVEAAKELSRIAQDCERAGWLHGMWAKRKGR